MEILLQPIGQVSNPINEKMNHGWENVESKITILPDLTESLEGIEEFSHITVLFWMHQNTGDVPVKVHPQRRSDMPLVGVFATRSPHRPNSIGLTTVKLLKRDDNVLHVIGLDAINGSPVLDIKPYLPFDPVAQAGFPEWISKLQKE